MGKFSLATSILLLAKAQGFTSPAEMARVPSTPLNMVPEEPAGSFFHQVPDDDDTKNGENEAADVDEAFSELLRQRRKPSIATTPSTIKGVPTSKATGFGKAKQSTGKKKAAKPFVGIGPNGVVEPPKRVNDPSKPEFDDQGYTLYTDKETGKKERVFEALMDYPCTFTMKIVGANEGSFVSEMVALVAEACGTQPDKVPYTTRSMGKWTSVTLKAPVQSSEMVYSLYEKVDLDPRVKFKF